MTQATTEAPTTNGNSEAPTTNGSKPKAERVARAASTPTEAIMKITKILDQLSLKDRKRVLAFVSDGTDEVKE